MSELITLDKFKTAIMNSMKTPGMQDTAAVSLAEHVLNFFGFQNRIIDNMLDPEDRDAFYMLEDVGLLTTEREETGLPDGREWRIHYWLIREDRIKRALQSSASQQKKSMDTSQTIYDTIPDDMWFGRSVEEEETEEVEEEETIDDIDWETPIIPGSEGELMKAGLGIRPPLKEKAKEEAKEKAKKAEAEDQDEEQLDLVSETNGDTVEGTDED